MQSHSCSLFSDNGRRLCLLLCVLALSLSGCIEKKIVDPYPGHPPVQPPPTVSGNLAASQTNYARAVLMPALARVSERISSYDRKAGRWQQLSTGGSQVITPDQVGRINSCRSRADDLRDGYKRLHSQLLAHQSVEGSRTLVTVTLPAYEQKDIAYLEGGCSQLVLELTTAPVQQQPLAAVSASDTTITSALQAGEYRRVISSYEAKPSGVQPDNNAVLSYGLALIKSGREEEGRRVLRDLLTRVRAQGHGHWEFEILQLLADLNFGLKNFPAARTRNQEINQSYNTLSRQNEKAARQLVILDSVHNRGEEVRAYSALVLGTLAWNPARDGFTVVQQAQSFQQRFPGSGLSGNVAELTSQANEDAEQWFSGLLIRADRLSAVERNQEAVQSLERVPLDILPMAKQDILKKKIDSLTAAAAGRPDRPYAGQEVNDQPLVQDSEAEVTSPGHVAVTALQENWDQGIVYMQSKEYDQAIQLFTALLNTSYGARAERQIKDASRLAAKEDRVKAAKLFKRADMTADAEGRRQLLLESRVMLEGILQKYPQAGLEEKVRRNIQRIDQELAAIEQI